jgi:hypothetical protein
MSTFAFPFNGNTFKELLSAIDRGGYYPIENIKL